MAPMTKGAIKVDRWRKRHPEKARVLYRYSKALQRAKLAIAEAVKRKLADMASAQKTEGKGKRKRKSSDIGLG